MKLRTIIKKTLSFCLIFLLVSSFILMFDFLSENKIIQATTVSPFNGVSLTPIDDEIMDNHVDLHISFTEFKASNNKSNYADYKIIIEDATDLYNFSEACNGTDASQYLDKHYILGTDINYDDEAQNRHFFTPIGRGIKGDTGSFSGTFDGQGHTITNLFMETIDDIDQYPELYYFAMFSHVGETGVVRNLGLINIINRFHK